jgi:hypothetical protein
MPFTTLSNNGVEFNTTSVTAFAPDQSFWTMFPPSALNHCPDDIIVPSNMHSVRLIGVILMNPIGHIEVEHYTKGIVQGNILARCLDTGEPAN